MSTEHIDMLMYFVPHILAFFAGASTMFALMMTLKSLEESASAALAVQRPHRMEMDSGIEDIAIALNVMK